MKKYTLWDRLRHPIAFSYTCGWCKMKYLTVLSNSPYKALYCSYDCFKLCNLDLAAFREKKENNEECK